MVEQFIQDQSEDDEEIRIRGRKTLQSCKAEEITKAMKESEIKGSHFNLKY